MSYVKMMLEQYVLKDVSGWMDCYNLKERERETVKQVVVENFNFNFKQVKLNLEICHIQIYAINKINTL